MALINPTLPTAGQPRASEDIDVLNALTMIRDAINGGLDSTNMAAALLNMFLRLNVAADRKLAFGTGIITYAGGTGDGSVVINHGLVVAPVLILGLPKVGGTVAGYESASLGAGLPTSTQFPMASYMGTVQPAGATLHFYWLAVG